MNKASHWLYAVAVTAACGSGEANAPVAEQAGTGGTQANGGTAAAQAGAMSSAGTLSSAGDATTGGTPAMGNMGGGGSPASGGAAAGSGGDGGSAVGAGGTNPIDPMEPVYPDPFGPEAQVTSLRRGVGITEGPAWIPEEKGFIFFIEGSTNTANRELYLWRIGETDYSEWFVLPGQNHGNIYLQGIVYGSNRLPGEIGRIRVSDKTYDPMPFEPTGEFAGMVLVVPNDLDLFSDGSVYFSEWSVRDVPANHIGYGIYRLFPNGAIERVIEGSRPNGVAFSADCRTLYTTDGDTLYARDVALDGVLSNQRTIMSRSRLNGIAVDSQGNVYLSGDGGMVAINAEGEQVASLGTQDPVVNFAFGGDDGKTLFFTTRNGLGWVNTRVRGAECNGLGK